MAKNFLIGMGGSGEKAVEAFIYLAAAGMVAQGNDVQIAMIDQDTTCGNYRRTADAHRDYESFVRVMEKYNDPQVAYKPCKIEYKPSWTLQSSVNKVAPNQLATDLKDTFGATTPGSDEADIIDCLFSAGEQLFKTNKGYYGHPTFGSLIVNAAMTTDSFKNESVLGDILQAHQLGAVNIFLVGSNFGGTGAATFPNVAKKIRESLSDTGNHSVRICGALLLPYFNLSSIDDKITDANADISVTHFYKKSAISLESYITEPVGGYDVVYGGKNNKYIYDRIVLVGSPSLQKTIVYDNMDKSDTLGGENQIHHLCLPDMAAALSACNFFENPDAFCDISGRSGSTDTAANLNYVAVSSTEKQNEAPGTIYLSGLPGGDISAKLEKFTRFALMTVGYYSPMIIREHTKMTRNAIRINNVRNEDFKTLFATGRLPFVRTITSWCSPEEIKVNIDDLSAANAFLSNYLKTIYRIQYEYTHNDIKVAKLFADDATSALGIVAPAAIEKENAANTNNDGWIVEGQISTLLSRISLIIHSTNNINKNGTTIRQECISGNNLDYDHTDHNQRVSRLLNLTFNAC